MLNLILINKEKHLSNVKCLIWSLGCSDYEIIESKIPRAARRSHSKSWRKVEPKKSPRILISIQGSCPPNSQSGQVSAGNNKVRQKCQDACMDDQGAPG